MQSIQSNPSHEAPRCAKCSYSFADLSAIERCPECGASVLESLAAQQHREQGRRLTSPKQVWGMPVYDIVVRAGQTPESQHARGWVAIGPKASGGIALGAIARGYIAIGAVSMGGVTMGATSIGVLPLGALAIGGAATGGLGIGLFAQGPMSIGVAAQGNVAIGVLTRGQVVIAPVEVLGRSTATMSANFFDTLSPIIGNTPSGLSPSNGLVWATALLALLGVFVCLLVRAQARVK